MELVNLCEMVFARGGGGGGVVVWVREGVGGYFSYMNVNCVFCKTLQFCIFNITSLGTHSHVKDWRFGHEVLWIWVCVRTCTCVCVYV